MPSSTIENIMGRKSRPKVKSAAVMPLLLLMGLPPIFFSSFQIAKAQGGAQIVRVVPETTTVRVGQTFAVNITCENMTSGSGIVGLEFNLTWSASVVKGLSMQEVMFHAAVPETEWGNIWRLKHVVSNGSVRYAYTLQDISRGVDGGYAPFLGNRTVVTITFRSIAAGETTLHFAVVKAGGMYACPTLVEPIDGKIIVDRMFAGDINQDGVVDFLDVSLLSQTYGSKPNGLNWHADADVNVDGIVDIYDAITLAGNYGKTA